MSDTLSTVAIVVGSAGFLAGGAALRTLARLRRSVALLSRGASGRETILDVTDKHVAASNAVRHDLVELREELLASQRAVASTVATDQAALAATVEGLDRTVHSALSRVALVRYDSFEELTGRLSFSLALLDDNGDGIALSSIAGTNETRLYAKSLSRGIGEQPLSPEEKQAVQAALGR
jgi:hypothetical protein